jgi:hypothetical protein
MRNILSKIDNQSKNFLERLTGKALSQLRVVTAGIAENKHGCLYNMAFLVELQLTGGENCLLHSKMVDEQCDGFSRLVVSQPDCYEGEYLSDLENTVTSLGMKWITKKVVSVTLFRDKVIWLEEGEKWQLDSESGIRFHCEDDTDLILFARDSSLGLMDVLLGKDVSWVYQPDQIAELYMIDESNIQEISRVQQSLP